ncbi:taste receptor type 2 member 1-like [Latimeria chalumnae]|nr:PREDICTED: taste receptor type 2 member 1-like [Latimeria chalumnae]|eukprot:XP_006013618.1 PREDICTED: taste receptor type 2 member 1-like [Latimeria chalumnae]
MVVDIIILQFVAELFILFFGFLGNFFIVHVYFLEYRKNRALQPTEVMVTFLALFNILIHVNLVIWFVVYLFNLCIYFDKAFYKVTDVIAIFLSKSSYWFTAWLCFFYCVKIVKVNRKLFVWLKQRISRMVNTLIIGTMFFSIIISYPCIYVIEIKTNVTSITQRCKDYYITGQSIEIYSPSLSFLGSFLPLALMVMSSMGIVIFLFRHSRNMTANTTTGSASRNDAHTTVAIMLICLIVLYLACTVTVFVANIIIAMIANDILIAISFTSSLYATGSSLILIIGTVKLRQSCSKLSCLCRRCNSKNPQHE